MESAAFQMWAILAATAVVVMLFVTEWVSMELTSLLLLSFLLVFFNFFPVETFDGGDILDAGKLIEGFANPALMTVLALLVVGEGLVRTGALDGIAQKAANLKTSPKISIFIVLITVVVLSAFMNNTPVVVIFIPILQVLIQKTNLSASKIMMPLSFVAILGGTTTLIGSSTNLLVSSTLTEHKYEPLTFFEVTPIASMLAVVGLFYVIIILPKFIPDRSSLSSSITSHGKQFIAQIKVNEGSSLIGETAVAGFFKSLPDFTVRMIQRKEKAILPPFDEFAVKANDVLVVAATKKALTEAVSRYPDLFEPVKKKKETEKEKQEEEENLSEEELKKKKEEEKKREEEEQVDRNIDKVLVEAMVHPSSRLIGMNIQQIAFRQRFGCIVLGIQRRAHMIRARMTNIRLESGDALLVQGDQEGIDKLRSERDIVVLSGTRFELPKFSQAKRTFAIFTVAITLAAIGVVPILLSAIVAATAMLAVGALNIRQAGRAIDRKIVLLVASALALGNALQYTGGASYIADAMISAIGDSSPVIVMSVFFLMIAIFTNLLSNNACAVLFTPIAISMADQMGVEPRYLAMTVLLAANCSFASPIGYQTNLLVMGPGQYQFSDFVKAGIPLVLIMWIAFTFIAPWYWGI